jgi:hypothetical protein
MAVDRFSRFKILQALWTRARTLLAWLAVPQDREARIRATRWQQIQVAERHVRDGIVRGTGDPDSSIRPQGVETQRAQHDTVRSAEWEAARAQWEAQRQWVETQQRAQQRRGR